ncbi:cytochrome c peroxidase [Pedobacter sp. ok626]|nr:cytochrome c peroxidase [Pedobacter sp. ok626]
MTLITWMACMSRQEDSKPKQVQNYYLKQIAVTDSLVKQLSISIEKNAPNKELQSLFKQSRLAYKKIEFLVEYYNPLTAKSINGAPIPAMDDNDQHKIDQPEGFQVIEPFLFPEVQASKKEELLREVNILIANFIRLKSVAEHQELANTQIFDALRLESFRIITLGISGFDAAIAQNSMAEAAQALQSVKEVLGLYKTDFVKKDEKVLANTLDLLQKGINNLQSGKDFNSFDRMFFITNFGNPISAAIKACATSLKIAPSKDLRALRVDAPTLFDQNAFDANFYTANAEAHMSPAKVELGNKLFYDPILSGTGSRSCGSCHKPEMAFTDGLIKSAALDGKSKLKRNTPTLLNSGFQPSLFYDNRVNYLEDQANDVINNKDEMHGSLPAAVGKLKSDSLYFPLFKKAFPDSKEPVSDLNIRNALGSYIRTLVSLNSSFDKYVRGDHSKLNKDQVNGFNLYMGKAKCGTCHFTPLFNGTVPPDFRTIETEVIGVPESANSKKIDADKGKYDLRKLSLYKNAFRTPTVRNIALTAPYMHNGIYSTLEEVIDFYNEGGGVGLGMDIPNQTLPFDKLNLTKKEKENIISFLKTLNDQ